MPTNELHWEVLRRHPHLLLLPLPMWFTDLSPLLSNFPLLQIAIAARGKYLPKLIQTCRAPFPSLKSNINKIQELTGRKLFLGIDWELQSYLTLLLLLAPPSHRHLQYCNWMMVADNLATTFIYEENGNWCRVLLLFVQEQIAMDK